MKKFRLVVAGLALIATIACNGSAGAPPVPSRTPAVVPTLPLPTATPSLIPEGYYNSPCQKPPDQTFYDWLNYLPMPGEHVEGGWDCSQKSAYVEWLAENCGYAARIAISCCNTDGRGHSWVLIDGIEDQTFAYEASAENCTETGGSDCSWWVRPDWASPPDPDNWGAFFQPDVTHESIYTLSTADPDLFLRAWGWWITYPDLYR